MIEAEILLDVADDIREHLLGVFAGNRGLRNIVEKGELPGAALLFGKQPRIFHRNRNLSCRGLHYFQVALLERIFAIGVQRRHHACRTSSQQNRRTAE